MMAGRRLKCQPVHGLSHDATCSACADMQCVPSAALVPPRQIGAFTVNEKGWKAVNPPHGGLIVTTSIHPDPCRKPHGDRVNQLSVLNKLDYVKLHGYEFHLVTHVVDKSLPKLCAFIAGMLKGMACCSCRVATDAKRAALESCGLHRSLVVTSSAERLAYTKLGCAQQTSCAPQCRSTLADAGFAGIRRSGCCVSCCGRRAASARSGSCGSMLTRCWRSLPSSYPSPRTTARTSSPGATPTTCGPATSFMVRG